MDNLSILIPFQSENGPREMAFKWVLKFYENIIPNAEICIGHSDSELFSRSQAINNAAKLATKDTLVIADADLIFDPYLIKVALNMLKVTAWVVPYYSINYITKDSTDKLLKTSPSWPLNIFVDAETVNLAKMGTTGGISVIPRKNFEKVGGYDSRFEGWGGEDDSFGFAMNTLCGQYKRIHSHIFHLWHPTEKAKGNPKYQQNLKLYYEYAHCAGNKEAMKNLIDKRLNNK